MAQKRRIFIASPQDLDSRTCHKTTKLRQTDIVYLVSEALEDEELPEPIQEFLSGKQVFVHTDDLVGFLRDRCGGKESIYFIGEHMEPVYEEIGNELLNYCDGVGKNLTFGVRNVRLKRLEQQTIDECMINTISSAIEKESQSGADQTDATPDDIIPAAQDTSQNDSPKNKESKKTPALKQRKDRNKKFGGIKKGNEDESPDSEIDLNALFEGGNAPDKKTSDAKAELIAALLDRIHRHAEAVLVQKISEDQYFQLMLIFMKSESLEEACDSWQCLQPMIPLKITTDEFSALKSEAVYYGRVSDMLYGEDLWNY